MRDKRPKLSLKELIDRANSGDRAALRRLRKRLDKNPHLWEHDDRPSRIGRETH